MKYSIFYKPQKRIEKLDNLDKFCSHGMQCQINNDIEGNGFYEDDTYVIIPIISSLNNPLTGE